MALLDMPMNTLMYVLVIFGFPRPRFKLNLIGPQ
jgi:hypothetical protein